MFEEMIRFHVDKVRGEVPDIFPVIYYADLRGDLIKN